MSFLMLNDKQVISRMGEAFKSKRKALKLSQEILSKKSNVSAWSIKKFEGGESVNLSTLVALYRSIGEISAFEALIPESEISPREEFFKNRSKRI